MITGTYDQLNEIIGRHVCGTCNGRVNVCHDAKKDQYYLQCGKCGPVSSLVEIASPSKLDKTTPSLPAARTMAEVQATDLGTGELLPREMAERLVQYAKELGLDAARDHVVVMYGNPYVTIDGYLYHANKLNIAYQMTSRPIDEEARATYKIGPDDHCWTAEIRFVDSGSFFTGTGIVTAEEIKEPSKHSKDGLAHPVVAKHPWQLAQKRAEWQALRRAFPLERNRHAGLVATDD